MMLVIDQIIEAKIKDMIKYAENNIIGIDYLLDFYNGEEDQVGDNSQRNIFIPNGYTVVYSHNQDPKEGLVRVLSVSIETPNRLPSPDAVIFIMQKFGFKNYLSDCYVKVQDVNETRKCIVVIEKI